CALRSSPRRPSRAPGTGRGPSEARAPRDADQVPDRRHARSLARGARRTRALLEDDRDLREDRDRLTLVLRAALLAAPGPRADDRDGRCRGAHAAAQVRPERARGALSLPGPPRPRARDARLPLPRARAPRPGRPR